MQRLRQRGHTRLEAVGVSEPIASAINIQSSELFRHIAFKYVLNQIFMLPVVGKYVSYLRPEDQDVCQDPAGDSLDDHAIAMRSFATFPPIDGMRLITFMTALPMKPLANRSGATVHDVQDLIANE